MFHDRNYDFIEEKEVCGEENSSFKKPRVKVADFSFGDVIYEKNGECYDAWDYFLK